jgi:hypothetical protein
MYPHRDLAISRAGRKKYTGILGMPGKSVNSQTKKLTYFKRVPQISIIIHVDILARQKQQLYRNTAVGWMCIIRDIFYYRTPAVI